MNHLLIMFETSQLFHMICICPCFVCKTSLLEVLIWSAESVLFTCELMRRIVVFEPTSFSYPLVGAALKRSTAS